MKQHYRTILVIGDNPDEIIKKYSEDTFVENSYLFLKRTDALKHKNEHINLLKKSLENTGFTENQRKLTEEYITLIEETSELEYFLEVTEGCTYDDNTGDAYTNKNPNAYYKYERSPQKIFEKTGEETGFCNPFKLKDDYISYSATKKEIDWKLNHLYNQEIYEAAWELVVEDREPVNVQEKQIKNNMKNRKGYFQNFKNKNEYVLHSTAFWTYGIATESFYKEVGMDGIGDKEWVSNFYDNFIKNLSDDVLLTIYEVQGLD